MTDSAVWAGLAATAALLLLMPARVAARLFPPAVPPGAAGASDPRTRPVGTADREGPWTRGPGRARNEGIAGDDGIARNDPFVRPAEALAVLSAVALATVSTRSGVAGVVAALVAIGGVVARRGFMAKREAETRRAIVTELCGTLSAELRAGRSASAALSVAAEDPQASTLLAAVSTAVHLGGDVPAGLVKASELPGAEGLRRVAACWSVAGESGAGLAAALDRLAESLRMETAVRREVSAQVASPRATARLLACLPFLALLLAGGTGADPLAVLLHTTPGLLCLLAGLGLMSCGLIWSERLIRAVEKRI